MDNPEKSAQNCGADSKKRARGSSDSVYLSSLIIFLGPAGVGAAARLHCPPEEHQPAAHQGEPRRRGDHAHRGPDEGPRQPTPEHYAKVHLGSRFGAMTLIAFRFQNCSSMHRLRQTARLTRCLQKSQQCPAGNSSVPKLLVDRLTRQPVRHISVAAVRLQGELPVPDDPATSLDPYVSPFASTDLDPVSNLVEPTFQSLGGLYILAENQKRELVIVYRSCFSGCCLSVRGFAFHSVCFLSNIC